MSLQKPFQWRVQPTGRAGFFKMSSVSTGDTRKRTLSAPSRFSGSTCPAAYAEHPGEPKRSRITSSAEDIWTVPYDPLPEEKFICRIESSKWLTDKFQDGKSKKGAITGTPGGGKTTLVVMYAHRNRHMYPGGVLWVDASTYNTLRNDYNSLATKLSEVDQNNSGDVNLSIKLVVDYLKKNEGWLLVLDNVCDQSVFDELTKHRLGEDRTDAEEYIPTNLKGHVIITSPLKKLDQLVRDSNDILELPLFNKDEQEKYFMVQLFNKMEKGLQTKDELDPSDRDALSQLASMANGLPLLMEQMTSFIAEKGISCTEYIELLEGDDIKLGKAKIDETKSVSNVYKKSFDFVRQQENGNVAFFILNLCAFCHFSQIYLEFFTSGFEALENENHPTIREFFNFFSTKRVALSSNLKVLLSHANNLYLMTTYEKKNYLSTHSEVQRQLRARLKEKGCIESGNEDCEHESCKNKECFIIDVLAKMFLHILERESTNSFLQKKVLSHIQSCAHHFSKVLENWNDVHQVKHKDLYMSCFYLQKKLGRILYKFSSIDEALKCFQAADNTLSLGEKQLEKAHGHFYRQKANILCEIGRAYSHLGEGQIGTAEKKILDSMALHEKHCSLCNKVSECKDKTFMRIAIAKIRMQRYDWPNAKTELDRAQLSVELAKKELEQAEMNTEQDKDRRHFVGYFYHVQAKFYGRRAKDDKVRGEQDLELSVTGYEQAIQFLSKDSFKYEFCRGVWLAYARTRLNRSDKKLLEAAKVSIHDVMEKTKDVPGSNHRFWLQAQIKYANVLFKLGETDAALETINAALGKISTVYARNNPLQLGNAHFVKGEILYEKWKRDSQYKLKEVTHHLNESKRFYFTNHTARQYVCNVSTKVDRVMEMTNEKSSQIF